MTRNIPVHHISGISITSSYHSNLLLDTRAGVVLWVSIVLTSRVGKARVVLGLAGDSVVGNATETVLGLAARNTAGTNSRLTDGTTTRSEAGFLAARANVDSPSIGRVEVGGDWGLVGKREVGLGLVDSLGVALHVDRGVGIALLRRNHFGRRLVLDMLAS